jgi:hypothetical protein
MMWIVDTGNSMNPKILFATTPTLEVAYEQTGPISGEPLLLLHGFHTTCGNLTQFVRVSPAIW